MALTNPFGPDVPNTPENERIDSALQNFITKFFGTVTKTATEDGGVEWALDGTLDDASPIPGFARNEGEGLASYLVRALQHEFHGLAGANGFATTTDEGRVQPPVNQQLALTVDDNSLFAVGQTVYIPGGGYYSVFAKGGTTGLSVTNLFSHEDSLHPGQLQAGMYFPTTVLKILPAGPIGATGAKGDTGATGPSVSFSVDGTTIVKIDDTETIKVASGAIGRVQLQPNQGDVATSDLGAIKRNGGLALSSAQGATGGLSVVVDDSTVEISGGAIRAKDAGITPAKLSDIARFDQNQYSDDSGSVNAYHIEPSPAPTAVAKGMTFAFIPTAVNTGASTLNVKLASGSNSANYAIRRKGAALKANELQTLQIAVVVYNGSYFDLVGVHGPASYRTASPYTTLPSAGAAVSEAHGLIVVPESVRVVLYCATAGSNETTAGYNVGDEVPVTAALGFADATSATNPRPVFNVVADANYVYVSRASTNVGGGSLYLPNKTTGAANVITASNWKLKIYAAPYLL